MRVVAVAAVMGAAALAYSLPRVRAQNSSTSSAAGAGVATSATSANGATTAATASNVPIVIAQGISVRALALGTAADSAAASSETSQIPPIYFTAAQMPNRVLSLAGASIGGNNASAMGAGMARGASNATAAQALRSSGQAEAYATVAGNGTAGSLGDGGAAASAQLSLKLDSLYMRSGVAVAADGTIFIADTENATIRRVSPGASAAEQDHRTPARCESKHGGCESRSGYVAQAGMPVLLKTRASLPASRENGDRRRVCSLSSRWGWRSIAPATFILRIMARMP